MHTVTLQMMTKSNQQGTTQYSDASLQNVKTARLHITITESHITN